MIPKVELTREEYNLIAEKKGIKEPHKMSTDALIEALHAKQYLYRKDYNLIAEKRSIVEPHKMSTEDLLNALYRYDIKRKSYSIRRKFRRLSLSKFIKKDVSESDLRKARKLQNVLDDLKKIAKLRRIKNYDDLLKEDLMYTILRSEKNLLEDNYTKYININTDDKIKAKTNNIRLILARLGNIVTKKDRHKIRKELYEIEKKKRLTKTQKEKIYNRLIEIANILDKIETYKYHNHDDLDYFRIRDIESLFTNIDDDDDDDYYKPVLVKSSFKNNYEYYEIRGGRYKYLSLNQYLYKITPELTGLINEKKNNNKNEQKI